MTSIYPSLISANLLILESEVKKLAPYCPGFHIDIMDNHFVPNLTWGAQFANAIAVLVPNKIMWIHLMVTNPLLLITQLSLPKNSIISFHIEINIPIELIINQIIANDWIPSIAIKPTTSISTILPLLTSLLNHVLVMSVEPGFSGQSFLESSIESITQLVHYRNDQNRSFSIGIDGGITENTITRLTRIGVNEFAVASAIFGKPNPVTALKELNQAILKNKNASI